MFELQKKEKKQADRKEGFCTEPPHLHPARLKITPKQNKRREKQAAQRHCCASAGVVLFVGGRNTSRKGGMEVAKGCSANISLSRRVKKQST